MLEDWADRAFMELSRRIAYHDILATPGRLGRMFFPEARGPGLWIRDRVARRVVARRFRIREDRHPKELAAARAAAALAVARIGPGPFLLGDRPTIADIALAAMSAPLAADRALAGDSAVATLLGWGERILGPEAGLYRSSPER